MDLTPSVDHGALRNRLLTAELILTTMIEAEPLQHHQNLNYELLRILIASARELIPDTAT